jgi:cold shock protein
MIHKIEVLKNAMDKTLMNFLLTLQKPERKHKNKSPTRINAKTKGKTMTEEVEERKFGIVKWFKAGKDGGRGSGYGFIEPESGGQDVFTHITEVNKSGYDTLIAGDRISYILKTDPKRGKTCAVDLRLEHTA